MIQQSGSGWGSWIKEAGTIVQSLKESFEAIAGNKFWHKEEDVITCGFPKLLPLSGSLFGLQRTLSNPPTPLLVVNGNSYSFWTLGLRGSGWTQTVATLIRPLLPSLQLNPIHTLASAHTHTHTHTCTAATNTCTAVITHAAGHTSRPPCGHQRSNYTSQYETHW